MTTHPANATTSNATGRARLWRRRAAWALAALVTTWVLGWLAVPPILRSQVEKQLTQVLGRQVKLQEVSFKPWSLEVELRGLSIARQDGSAPQLEVQRIYVDAELQSLLRLAPVIDAVTIDEPKAYLKHNGEGRYDIDDVLEKLSKPEEPSKPLPRFAVFNIAVNNGSFEFLDAPVNATHKIEQLQLQVPFLSSLPSRRDVVTQPHLSFMLNGDRFDTTASTTPFASTRHTEASIQLPDLDLAPYLPYWPAKWPVRPTQAELQLALTITFEQQDTPKVRIKGKAALSNLAVNERLSGQDKPLFGFERLSVDVENVEPMAGLLALNSVELRNPQAWLRRDNQGRLNIESLARAWAPAKSGTDSAPAPAPSWQVSLAKLQVSGGIFHWYDASTSPAADVTLEDTQFQLTGATWPAQKAAPFQGSTKVAGATISWNGEATQTVAKTNLTFEGLPLNLARPYLSAVLKPELDGALAATLDLAWNAEDQPDPGLTLLAKQVELRGLALRQGRQTLAGLDSLKLENASVHTGKQTVNIAKIAADGPQANVSRRANGQWMFQEWLHTAPTDTDAKTGAEAVSKPKASWKVAVQALAINRGKIAFRDETPGQPVRLNIQDLRLDLQEIQPMAEKQALMPMSLALNLSGTAEGRRTNPGSLRFQGNLRLPPGSGPLTAQNGLLWQGRLNADHLPLHAFEPYVAQYLNLELLRADTSVRGTIDVGMPAAGTKVGFRGDLAVEDFRANTLQPSEDLLNWKALNLRGIDLAWSATQPLKLNVAETVLSDYYARVLIDETGRINLQDLVRSAPNNVQASAANTTTEPSTPAQPAAPASTSAADIRFGPVGLVNGRVAFADRFIRPNYSANLSDLSGSLGAFASTTAGAPPQMADLSLRGRVEGTATLDISGKLNPLAKPLAMDIKGVVRELELPPLSPYTVKYAGYGIERGKLSMDVNYRIDPDGTLNATNQVILNQLRFGDRSPDSDAPNLPVKLAVALLADRNGVIDINLPVSGSINDPQFRIGPIVVRLIFNLIGKAITAPFSLLASAFSGGGEDMSQVAFLPGQRSLNADATKSLDAVAKALSDRPALQLTVVGHSDLETEREGWRRARLDEWIQAEKRRQLARDGQTINASVSVKAEEYPTLLKEVYRRADIPKPRNIIGIAKDIPLPEMESLLLASIPVTSDAMRELALARAVAVKDYLIEHQVPTDRLFMNTAPCVASSAAPAAKPGDAASAATACKPVVELRLEAR